MDLLASEMMTSPAECVEVLHTTLKKFICYLQHVVQTITWFIGIQNVFSATTVSNPK